MRKSSMYDGVFSFLRNDINLMTLLMASEKRVPRKADPCGIALVNR